MNISLSDSDNMIPEMAQPKRRKPMRRCSIGSNNFNSMSTLDMQDILTRKNKPHYSQLYPGKFELLSVDDDPINQECI